MKKILEIKNLKKNYGLKDSITYALRNVNFDVYEGEFVGIMGASGSGKTTLLNCIATILKPTSGEINLRGKDISKLKNKALAEYRGSEIGYLFQDFQLLDNLTGYENIALPLSIHNTSLLEIEDKIKEISKTLNIEDILRKFPSEMSGGQKQRIAAARCLVSDPSIVLADEPTGALDSKSAKTLLEMMFEINKKVNKTFLMVTHDANAASYCSRILFIQDGEIFHELIKEDDEDRSKFYDRVLSVMSYLGGGSNNVL